MKQVWILAINIVTAFSALSGTAISGTSAQQVQCFVNTRQVHFVSVPRTTLGMSLHKAALDSQTSLFWSYSMYYGKGGTVELVQKTGAKKTLLIWDNESADDVLDASARHGNATVHCKLVSLEN